MKKEHPASYAMELKKSWRVIVPVRGRLEPRICQEKFSCRADALSWMDSAEGKQAIALVRGGWKHAEGDNAQTSILAG